MYSQVQSPEVTSFSWLFILGFILVFAGIALITLSVLMPMLRAGEKVRGEGGAIIMIGPIPIIMATSERMAKLLIVLAILLMGLAILIMLLFPATLKRFIKVSD